MNLDNFLLTPQVACSVYDQATPGTGPPGLVSGKAPNVEISKYNDSFNLSLKSKSDLNLNPTPDGFIKTAFPRFQKTREGVYAIETDPGKHKRTASIPKPTSRYRQTNNKRNYSLHIQW